MPLYAKFMKELLTHKRNWKEQETVVLTKECSAIIQHNLPKKMPDPRSFVIPCTIGDVTIQRALCDLRASINLMPLSLMKKFQIEEVKSTHMKEEVKSSIILGRPFLDIGKALIDVQNGELTLRVNEEQVVLHVFETLKCPNDSEGCMKADVIKPLVQEVLKAEVLDDILDPISEYELVEIDNSHPRRLWFTRLKQRRKPPSLSSNPYPLL
ncbi:uncharacterized protein LOC130949367 [Arachis stenosperma]|uniref:uncharacterized protein LOC130949367 n=1 Tax=Arachis stenosperma TaxID=217475 RepID=UPI0025ACCD79|nr:uncharacterized protein LOC130949367 [Arachis stenosperma]